MPIEAIIAAVLFPVAFIGMAIYSQRGFLAQRYRELKAEEDRKKNDRK